MRLLMHVVSSGLPLSNSALYLEGNGGRRHEKEGLARRPPGSELRAARGAKLTSTSGKKVSILSALK